jgi:hypothetical protein
MAEKTSHKTAEKAAVDNASETGAVKEPSMALEGVKKGAAAAKQAVSTIASAPSRMLDSAVYGVSYGISYGAVFSALMVVKILPADGLAIKGFHEGAKAARKDFKTHEQKQAVSEKHEHKHAAERTVSES